MSQDVTFRRARAGDREPLNEMTLAGLRYWGHDRNHPEAYEGLAAILSAADGPESHPVFVLEERAKMVGFYELRDRGDHVELLRMFIRPELIGQGYGRTLWSHAVRQAASMSDRMLIMADPGAVGFYQATGADLARHEEIAPGFLLGVYWYDLTRGASRPSDSEVPDAGTPSD